MQQQIRIITDFDITNTGVVRNYRDGMLPQTVNGKTITDKDEWIKLRRQQANWETLIQIISLRTQPLNIKTNANKYSWTLEFEIDTPDVYRKGHDPLGLLRDDIANIPLLTGLDEKKDLENPSVKPNLIIELHDD